MPEDELEKEGIFIDANPAEPVYLRHVMLNNLLRAAPGAPLGIEFGAGRIRGAGLLAITRCDVWQGTQEDTDAASRAGGAGPSSSGGSAGAEARGRKKASVTAGSPLISVGDYVVGVSGASVEGLNPAQLTAAVAAVRASTSSGVIVLHLSRMPIFVDEILRLQMEKSARQLLGSQEAVVAAYQTQWQVIYGGAALV